MIANGAQMRKRRGIAYFFGSSFIDLEYPRNPVCNVLVWKVPGKPIGDESVNGISRPGLIQGFIRLLLRYGLSFEMRVFLHESPILEHDVVKGAIMEEVFVKM